MPKMKTHTGAAKRFFRTKTGKVKRYRAFHSHILGKKSPKRKRRLRSSTLVSSSDVKRIEKLMPYK